jgi:hypothetical protein
MTLAGSSQAGSLRPRAIPPGSFPGGVNVEPKRGNPLEGQGSLSPRLPSRAMFHVEHLPLAGISTVFHVEHCKSPRKRIVPRGTLGLGSLVDIGGIAEIGLRDLRDRFLVRRDHEDAWLAIGPVCAPPREDDPAGSLTQKLTRSPANPPRGCSTWNTCRCLAH